MKTQQQIAEELGVRPYFYYMGQIATVCLLKKEDKCVARGVSICSPLDQFNRATGRAKSFGRAIKAVVRQESNCSINLDRFYGKYEVDFMEELHRVESLYGWKSAYLPKLTEYERRILYKPLPEFHTVA